MLGRENVHMHVEMVLLLLLAWDDDLWCYLVLLAVSTSLVFA
jgi:hypothetical protein